MRRRAGRTPESDEHGEEDGARVVEHPGDLGVLTGLSKAQHSSTALIRIQTVQCTVLVFIK